MSKVKLTEDESSKPSNLAKGRNSFDAKIDGTIVPFFNKNITPYPTEVSSPKFDLIPVTKQKDLMINHARMYAEQEYNRIMELVEVLQKQAGDIKRRLDITDMVYAAEYQFQIVMGQYYWLVQDKRKNRLILTMHGPTDWHTGSPEEYDYITQVKYMGDHTWMEINNDR